jgi:hypothetical protein
VREPVSNYRVYRKKDIQSFMGDRFNDKEEHEFTNYEKAEREQMAAEDDISRKHRFYEWEKNQIKRELFDIQREEKTQCKVDRFYKIYVISFAPCCIFIL